MKLYRMECWLSYFTDLQGSQTEEVASEICDQLSYFTDLQGSQTIKRKNRCWSMLSYFTDLQGSQTWCSSLQQSM